MRILPQGLIAALSGAMDLILPGACLLCRADSGRAPLCAACAADLPRLTGACCPQCAEPTAYGERCGRCLAQPPDFDATLALYRYDFPVDGLIHALKYGHQLALAAWFGEQLGEALAGRQFDRVIPLALHRRRLRQRGFNQATEIARTLCRETGWPLDIDSLIRSRDTPPQAELPLKARAANLRGAFECRRDLSGQTVLLIDDVLTSGATLREAARVLKLHGATSITLGLIARALRHG